MRIVGGDEDDARTGAHMGHEIEAGAAAELHIEKHQVVIGLREPGACGRDRADLADDVDGGVIREQRAQDVARGRSVVDDEGAHEFLDFRF